MTIQDENMPTICPWCEHVIDHCRVVACAKHAAEHGWMVKDAGAAALSRQVVEDAPPQCRVTFNGLPGACDLPAGHDGDHRLVSFQQSSAALSRQREQDGRTLADYRPQHDVSCDSLTCKECGYHEGIHVNGYAMGYGSCADRVFKPRGSCSCGLDRLLAEFDAPGAQERTTENKDLSRYAQPQLRAGESDPRGDDRAITLPHLETPGCHETVGGMCHHFVLSPDTCDCGVVERNEANR